MSKNNKRIQVYNYSGGHEVDSVRNFKISWWWIAALIFALLMVGFSLFGLFLKF